MKIYTKTGDTGKTSLICGKRLSKHDVRIEAYGVVDELISWVGLLRDQYAGQECGSVLLQIQDRLMVCASILAADCDRCRSRIPSLKDSDVNFLESEIDRMEPELVPLSSFILPGGHTTVSWCHIARNVCRRAERKVTRLSAEEPTDPLVVRYLNRLSDFLFVLSRKISRDLNVDEIPWAPEL
jgi:cob(I)alamin adenosyltransferase